MTQESPAEDAGAARPQPRRIKVFGRQVTMPQSRPLRILIGILLVLFGCLGFLPILGFWMIPLGLLVLSYEFASVRRWRRRTAVWWHRRREKRAGPKPARRSA